MAQTTFTDNVFVDGSQDTKQLRVQGNAVQNQALQTWENSAGTSLAQVTSDGRVLVGDDVGLTSPDALVEAHRAETSTAKPKRGFHALGRMSDSLTNVAQWIVQELEIRGANSLSALQTALRVRASNMNTGTPIAGAELRAADIEVINEASAGAAALPVATGLQVGVTNAAGKTITQATGLYVKMNNAGTITTPYAIYTQGAGVVHLDDYVEVKRPTVVPGTPVTDYLRIYPKADGKLYAKNWSGVEYDLTSTGGATPYGLCNGRLTLTTATPITTADVTAATTLYFTPYHGNQLALYNGSSWSVYTFSERSLSLSALLAAKNYDIFIYDNAGTLTLEAVAWTSDTARATGLVLQDGVYVKSGATARRYLGTIRTTIAGQTEDSRKKRFIWNYYNRTRRGLSRLEATPSWTYSTASYRMANGDSANRLEIVLGLAEDAIALEVFGVTITSIAGSHGASVSIGEDNTTTPDSEVIGSRQIFITAGEGGTVGGSLIKIPSAGYHYYQWLELGAGLGTQTWYSNSTAYRSGILGSMFG